MTARKYVTAFAGARDSYQVPLALAQTNQLDCLITDLYLPQLPSRLTALYAKLARRSNPGLSVWDTRSSLGVIWHSYVRWRLSSQRTKRQLASMKWSQDQLARLAGERAVRKGCDLFLYAGYALEAFKNPRLANARRILFMYHPHIALSSDILLDDALRYPEANSSRAELTADREDRTVDRELELADLIVCASEFTASTVRAIGIDGGKLVVIPYGIDAPAQLTAHQKSSEQCHFLFVGSGIHRKGLHVLFDAWKDAALPNARLTIACRYIEPWIEARSKIPGVTLRLGVSDEELDALYMDANVFVMPSLVEGFGYVYLEALVRGCFCIGTRNTGLPDLQLSPAEAITTAPGDQRGLSEALANGYERWKGGHLEPAAIQKAVGRWTWERFRTSISECAQKLQSPSTSGKRNAADES